jgi:hypothetical protein
MHTPVAAAATPDSNNISVVYWISLTRKVESSFWERGTSTWLSQTIALSSTSNDGDQLE